MIAFVSSCRRSIVGGSLTLIRFPRTWRRRGPASWSVDSTHRHTVLVRYKSTGGPMVEDQYWKSFQEHAQAIGVVLALFAATYYVGGSYIGLKKDIELVRLQAEKEIAVIRAQAGKDVVQAKKETAERFLMYGYAEEFHRYQKTTGMYKNHGQDDDASEE